MFILIFILALTLLSLSILLMGLTMNVKLPFSAIKKEYNDEVYNIQISYNQPKHIKKSYDLGILNGRHSGSYIKHQIGGYTTPSVKAPLLLEYRPAGADKIGNSIR